MCQMVQSEAFCGDSWWQRERSTVASVPLRSAAAVNIIDLFDVCFSCCLQRNADVAVANKDSQIYGLYDHLQREGQQALLPA